MLLLDCSSMLLELTAIVRLSYSGPQTTITVNFYIAFFTRNPPLSATMFSANFSHLISAAGLNFTILNVSSNPVSFRKTSLSHAYKIMFQWFVTLLDLLHFRQG